MNPRYVRASSAASRIRSPTIPLTFVGTSGRSLTTIGYCSTVPAAEQSSKPSPIRNRQRVSSQALVQSMSVLRHYAFEKDFLEGYRNDVDRDGIECARFVDDRSRAAARQHREHAPIALHAHGRRPERRRRRVVFEHQLDAAVVFAQLVERAGNDRASAI